MTKPRPILLAITAMILTLAGVMAAYVAPHGARSPSAGPTVSLPAASKGCGMVRVALRGSMAPTITCVGRTRPPIPAGHTGRAFFLTTASIQCNDPRVNFQVITYNTTYCYEGSGYLGLSPTLAEVVAVSGDYRSWVRLYYNGAGTYFNVRDGGVNEWFLGTQGFAGGPENVIVSQICDDCGYHS